MTGRQFRNFLPRIRRGGFLSQVKTIFALLLAATAANADTLQQADLAKLQDPARRDAEVARLAGCDKGKKTLTRYHLLTANQADGKAPLHVLCAAGESNFFRDWTPFDGYRIENPAELFGEIARPVVSRFDPGLDPVRDSQILVFDSAGKEIRPFGGDNYTNEGYFFDFDHDGILDRVDSNHHSVKEAPKVSVEVFSLESIEPKPRKLLEVVFNWHPQSAPDANDWKFTCVDEDHDGIAEIAFGPESATTPQEQRQFVFRWDPAAKRYSAGDIPEHSHIRVMMPGDTLASIAKAGGLGYPLVKDPEDRGSDGPPAPSPQAPYVFQSFKDRPSSEIAAFFQGKRRRDTFSGPEDSFRNRLPENFRNLAPKDAALALADANRTPSHRARWKLAVDDRGGLTPPKSGWLLHDWGSSGCYSYSSHLFALRFGVPDPRLIVFEYNAIGVVGRNPWADQPAHSVRVIRLSEEEARFLADTVFWLDRLRTFSIEKSDRNVGFRSSTADGSATASLYPDGAAPRELASGTVWAMSSISAGWNADYTMTTFANLAEFLIADNFPAMLGERWTVVPQIEPHSLRTSTEERLAPRVDDGGRQKLSQAFAGILQQNTPDPIPAVVVKELVQAAADEALTELLPDFESMLAALPAPDAEDQEFATLEKRFATDHFGERLGKESEDDKKALSRLVDLRKKREFLPSAILRDSLNAAIARLGLVGSAADLKKAVAENGPDSRWALSQFHRLDPLAWSDLVAGQFKDADLASRRTIFETLAAGNPPAAGGLITAMTPTERFDLIVEIAGYHRDHEAASVAADLPVLMELVRDRKQDFIRRGEAMALLSGSGLPAGMLKEFTDLLVSEIKDPQKGKYQMDTLDSAITALSELPGAADHLDLITGLPGIETRSFGAGFAAILRMSRDHPGRKNLLAGFIRPRFIKGNGMMDDIFLDVLAFDLRVLAPDISTFASEGPAVPDGDGADYSGGNFKTPVGQRYHMAREITALWAESDPDTRARMWIHFVAAHPYEFDPGRNNKPLCELAAGNIRAMPEEMRRREIDVATALNPIPDHASATGRWLRKLERN